MCLSRFPGLASQAEAARQKSTLGTFDGFALDFRKVAITGFPPSSRSRSTPCRTHSMTKLVSEAARSWSSTLRLPKSSFPARSADLSSYLQRCTDELYSWQETTRSCSKPFILHDGPPYANGELHAGHALNKILKDIICRTKLAEGRRVKYVPGWDCHGLPIELKALEHHGWNNQQKDNSVAVRQAARQFAKDTVEKQMKGFKSWGVMGDWANHWKTMDKDYELRQLTVFRAMAQKGLIYRKHKPVYWSPSSQTALAEAELEYNEDHMSKAALVKFPLSTKREGSEVTNTYAAIWTTTPWTLPANQAIAFSKELQYSRVLSPTHGQLLFAKVRLPYMESLLGEKLQVIDEQVGGDEMLSMTYRGPKFLDSTPDARPFFTADFVTPETGTGLVHCAPGHGMEDYDALQPLIRAGQVDVKAPVDEVGRFTKEAAPKDPQLLEGKEIFTEGNKLVLQGLEDENLLLSVQDYKHKYPYDWRTKQPIMIRATAQWFADISSIKKDALGALEKVNFKPPAGQARLKSFVENRNEWCISRQRAWGVPIPALYDKTTGEEVLSDKSISHIMKVIEERGIDAWWSDSADDPAWIVDELTAGSYIRGTDTMDVWFDSGTSWMHMLDKEETQTGPLADIYIEGTDQHRGWFQSSLLTDVACQKSLGGSQGASAPFRALITHGFTLDGEGKKMSKSIGNVVSPDEIISGVLEKGDLKTPVVKKSSKKQREQLPLGPDTLRLWVASSDWTKDVIVSLPIIQTVHNALHKYRVTFKYLLGALQDFDPEKIVEYSQLSKIDQMALCHLHQVVTTTRSASDSLEIYKAVTAINRWVNADFSGVYMEASKDFLYCESIDSRRRLGVQTVLYHILCQMQAMLAPLLPILVEETWAHTPVQLQATLEHPLHRVWAVPPAEWYDRQLAEHELPLVMSINTAVKSAQEKARSDKRIGSSLESDVELHLDASAAAILQPWMRTEGVRPALLQDVLVVSGLRLSSADGHSRNELPGGGGSCSEGAWSYREAIVLSTGPKGGWVMVQKPSGSKCGRCWKYTVSQSSKDLDGLCDRCHETVDGVESKEEAV